METDRARMLIEATVVLAALLLAFGITYTIKSMAGIDLFPDFHLWDIFGR